MLDESGLANHVLHHPLDGRLVDMVAPLFARPWIHPSVVGGEDELSAPLGGGIGVLPRQGMRQDNSPPSLFHVSLMQCPGALEMLAQRPDLRLRQHGDPILGTLAVTYKNLVSLKIEILRPQAKALHEAQS